MPFGKKRNLFDQKTQLGLCERFERSRFLQNQGSRSFTDGRTTDVRTGRDKGEEERGECEREGAGGKGREKGEGESEGEGWRKWEEGVRQGRGGDGTGGQRQEGRQRKGSRE